MAKKKSTRTSASRKQLQQRSQTCSDRLEWNEHQIGLLGTASDCEVARILQIGPTSVAAKRNRLRIAPFGKSNRDKTHVFPKKAIALLGTLPDREIAERFAISADAVRWKRRSLGLAPQRPGRRGREWTKKEVKLLGKMPDATLAKKLGIRRRVVALKRAELGIPNLRSATREQKFTKEFRAAVGKATTAAVAAQFNLTEEQVRSWKQRHGVYSPADGRGRRNRWTDANIAQLGKVPDIQLAEELKLTRGAVAAMRKKLGIPAFRSKES